MQKYNYHKYVELLNYDQLLREQNKFLKNEDKIKYSELKNYALQINEYLHWSHKHEYLQLIQDFLNFKIDGKMFEENFSNLVEEIEKESSLLSKDYEKLKVIDPDPVSFEFAKWISEIYLYCDEFYPNYDEIDPPDFLFAKNEKNFRKAVFDILPELEKY